MPTPTERGCLVLADITGYTAYLTGAELDHAHDVLADLMGTVVAALRPPMRLAKLEGDAAFVYAPEGKVSGSLLLDTVEQCYFAFRRRVRDIRQATTCQCNACIRIPSLDLKLFVHDGEFARHRVAGREELAGTDVILVHRLMKNRVSETLGLQGYALFTDACLRAAGLDPAVLGLRQHVETYEHIGEVRGYVLDLRARWAEEQERRRVYVGAKGAVSEIAFDFDAPPSVVWDYLTDPAKRVRTGAGAGISGMREESPRGRRGPGTVNHCAHGPDTVLEEVLDWRPFEYFTVRFRVGFPIEETIELIPAQGGTRVVMRQRIPPSKQAREGWAQMRETYMDMMRKVYEGTLEALAEDGAREA
ncbi:MAG: DUF2652 domain-containing protein [Armatimonadota bacterium]|nr:DUF2652 domain-containing protein [Armatimonadota bacterium]MDR7453310.1 DUF2652 domain-containing protein [Armatimonadota bacterium]MDR7456490.1 DUF2652 domain-containing protein [Armatimonadota bacterium]MDR7496243.1 DUF2652 domain-containing protein [Armatimonadota bacterium]MDR7512398.1 DUF2652 domain-containing protein [Armatimonadota bacterium]